MKFDYVIGNPPYQNESNGELRNYAPPVYHLFLDESYKIGNKIELIHPARFLFNAGSTPKEWNQKMLNDKHFKVLLFEQDSSKIFANTDIKGGICVSYRNTNDEYEPIGAFSAFDELNHILKKVKGFYNFTSLCEIIIPRTAYRLTPKLHEDHPEALSMLSNGHPYDMASNIFDRLPHIFYEQKPNDEYEYIKIIGRKNNQRVLRYIRKEYVNSVLNLHKYKVIVPQANGSGALGEVLSTPIIGEPFMGETETFISIGAFDTKKEADNAYKYIISKFARTMLGVLKVTQNNNKDTWKYVPMQDFTDNSDIDWSKSVAEIDRQLYKKYGLSEEEITFIETHVKEME